MCFLSVSGPKQTVAELIREPLKAMCDALALVVVATLIDQSDDEGSLQSTQQPLRMLATIKRRKPIPPHKSMVYYFRANPLHIKSYG